MYISKILVLLVFLNRGTCVSLDCFKLFFKSADYNYKVTENFIMYNIYLLKHGFNQLKEILFIELNVEYI